MNPIAKKSVRIIKTCMHEMSRKVRTCKHISDLFTSHDKLKQENTLSPVSFLISAYNILSYMLLRSVAD